MLEERLAALQEAHSKRCGRCSPLLNQLQLLERRLNQLLAERRDQLQDLAAMKYVEGFSQHFLVFNLFLVL